jgi:hypothetical protein
MKFIPRRRKDGLSTAQPYEITCPFCGALPYIHCSPDARIREGLSHSKRRERDLKRDSHCFRNGGWLNAFIHGERIIAARENKRASR